MPIFEVALKQHIDYQQGQTSTGYYVLFTPLIWHPVRLIWDGNSEIDAHVLSEYWIWFDEGICLDRQQSQILDYLQKRPDFNHAWAELPPKISTMRA